MHQTPSGLRARVFSLPVFLGTLTTKGQKAFVFFCSSPQGTFKCPNWINLRIRLGEWIILFRLFQRPPKGEPSKHGDLSAPMTREGKNSRPSHLPLGDSACS